MAAPSVSTGAATPRPALPVAPDAVAAPPNLEPLQAACPSLVGKLAEECASALERRFAGNSMWYPRTVLLPELTAADIFALTESTLAGVQTALSRPECRVPAGRFRTDLREICAADAMAKLALLHRKCSEWVDADPDRTKRLHIETMLDEARWDVEGVRECLDIPQVPSPARRSGVAGPRARPCAGRLRRAARPLRAIWWATMWLSNPLLRAAIRVGSELALMQLPLHPRQLEEEPLASMFTELEAHNPTLAHVKMAQTALSDTKTLAHAMAAQMLAPLQRLERGVGTA